eukprot:767635-Hanusia_phi.AAC.1
MFISLSFQKNSKIPRRAEGTPPLIQHSGGNPTPPFNRTCRQESTHPIGISSHPHPSRFSVSPPLLAHSLAAEAVEGGEEEEARRGRRGEAGKVHGERGRNKDEMARKEDKELEDEDRRRNKEGEDARVEAGQRWRGRH